MANKNTLIWLIRIFIISIITIGIEGCGSGTTTSNNNQVQASMSYVIPKDGAHSVQANPQIYFGFNSIPSESWVELANKVKLIDESNNVVPAKIIMSNTNLTVYIQLESSLVNGSTYSLWIPKPLAISACNNCFKGNQYGVLNESGNAMLNYVINDVKQNSQMNTLSLESGSLTESQIYKRATNFALLATGVSQVDLTTPVISSFVYIANHYFDASAACKGSSPFESPISEACFTGTNSNGQNIGSGIQAANWICNIEAVSQWQNGSSYNAFISDNSSSDATNNIASNVLLPGHVYGTFNESINTFVPFFYTSGSTGNAYIVAGEYVQPNTPASTVAYNWWYWTGADTTGAGTSNSCAKWSTSSTPGGDYSPWGMATGNGNVGNLFWNYYFDSEHIPYYESASTFYNDGYKGCNASCDGELINGYCSNGVDGLPGNVNPYEEPIMCVQEPRDMPFVYANHPIDSILTLLLYNPTPQPY